MKKLSLLFLASVLYFSCNNEVIDLRAEPPCDNGTFVGIARLTSQQEVDEFGALCYTKIDGLLALHDINEPSDKIVDLSPLNSLIEIYSETYPDSLGGSLYVATSKLINLKGLENLIKVSRVRIEKNESLETLEGLNSLVEITNGNYGHNLLLIQLNPSLQSLNGLESLRIIGKDDYFTNVAIKGNPQLQNIDGLQNLTTIGGPDSQNNFGSPSLNVVGNDSLRHLNGLASLNFVKGYIKFLFSHDMIGPEGPQVYGNINLTDFCGLQNLLVNGSYEGLISVSSYYDGFGPSAQDIIDGNCSQ